MALRYLLSAAGSTASTAAGAIARRIESRGGNREMAEVAGALRRHRAEQQEQALVELLRPQSE